MLHFDMLRLFGPLTSELDKESIPYQTNSDQTVTPLLSGSEVVGLILDDLKNAVGLLKDTDPYFVEEEFSDTDLNYRRFRMNYFAAKGLMRMITVIRFGLLIIKTELRYSIIANSKSRIM